MQHTPVSYGSFITPYTDELTGAYGAIREMVDSSKAIRITSYMNQCLLDLYFRCFSGSKGNSKKDFQFLFSPNADTALDFLRLPPGVDSLLYTSDPWVIQRPLTTEEIVRSKYCYEQVVPLSMSKEECQQIMLEDLNRYFKIHYGIVGVGQNRKVLYYELVRTSDQDKLTTDSLGFHAEVVKQGGQLVLDYKGPLYTLFGYWLRNEELKIAKQLLYDSTGHPLLIYNGTNWDRKQLVSMKIPLERLQTIADVRHLLRTYGLDLVERYDELPFWVFSKVENHINDNNP
jgi:hypothetical protein